MDELITNAVQYVPIARGLALLEKCALTRPLDFVVARTMLAASHYETIPMPDAEQHRSQFDQTDEKLAVTSLLKLRAPLGGQEIELQQLDYIHGGSSLLRVRIREGRRFTVFDLDAATASSWAATMGEWASGQLQASECSDGR